MNKNKLNLLLAMLIFGTIGIFRKNIALSSATIACFRGVIGTMVIVAYKYLTKNKIDYKAIKNNLTILVFSGIMMGINWILLFEAYNYTSVAIATAVYYLAPIFMSLGAAILFKEKLTVKSIGCVLLSFVGVILISNINEISGLKGILLALASALLYASVVLCNRKISDINSFDKTFVQLFAAGIVLVPYILAIPNTNSYDLMSLSLLAIVCVIHTGLAYVLYFSSVKDLPTSTVSIYSYVDPILPIVLSALLLKEHMSIMALVGIIMILASTFINEKN